MGRERARPRCGCGDGGGGWWVARRVCPPRPVRVGAAVYVCVYVCVFTDVCRRGGGTKGVFAGAPGLAQPQWALCVQRFYPSAVASA